jgi:ribonuclease HI
MELMAAIIALEEVGGRGVVVEVTTDSKYLQLGITEWITSWKARGWRNANNKPVANRDLWERLEKLVEPHNITWHHVRGHRGHVENERVDKIAGIAARANPTDVDVGFEKSA